MLKIDLGLTNAALYEGCEIETVAGRGNLKTPVAKAVNIVGFNIEKMLREWKSGFTPTSEHAAEILGNPPSICSAEAEEMVGHCRNSMEAVTLTGPMAVWAYLVVFHAVVHRFSKVYYDDGRTGAVLIAAHG